MTWTWRQTREMLSRGDKAPATLPPSRSTLDGRPTRPDRLSIWPIEDDTFGLDVLYLGDQGKGRAETVARQLEKIGQPVKLRSEGEGAAWTVRVGPVSREDMLTVVNGYIW